LKTSITRREALTAAADRLAQNPHLADTSTRDAETLLLHILQIPRSNLLAYPDSPIIPDQQTAYEAAIARRLTHEPIQYITGVQEFYGLLLHVTPAVLIPRPETELLVEAVLTRLSHSEPLRILDVGTGSGAIAIAIARHLPLAQVTAVDISPDALAIARHNATIHCVADRISLLPSDLLSAVEGETYDAILSNPPYVSTADQPTLHPQVRDHEPPTALYAGPTGLDVYTRLIPAAHAALTHGGLLALELGHQQSDAIEQLLSGWNDISFVKDLQQILRVALARKA
jgi:release factor glutamine methyltransferase